MYKIANALGLDESHVAQVDWGDSGVFRLHVDTIAALELLKNDAQSAGFELAIASGFRSFDRQLAIWRAKALGERPVLDDFERPIDLTSLTPFEKVRAIMRWSALPGGSRHHWGSDFDVYPRNLLASGEALLLTQAECKGAFKPFYEWLDNYLVAQQEFARPFTDKARQVLRLGQRQITCGVAAEPWHLSYLPVASQFEQLLTEHALTGALRNADAPLLEELLANWPAIYNDYIAAYFA